MKIINNNIKWIMLVSGLITSSMIYAAIAPEQALMATFGASISGPIVEIVVRNWGVLIAITGVLLMYGAFKPEQRTLALVIAVMGKLTFVSLVLTFGQAFWTVAAPALIFDSLLIFIFIYHLFCLHYKNLQQLDDVPLVD